MGRAGGSSRFGGGFGASRSFVQGLRPCPWLRVPGSMIRPQGLENATLGLKGIEVLGFGGEISQVLGFPTLQHRQHDTTPSPACAQELQGSRNAETQRIIISACSRNQKHPAANLMVNPDQTQDANLQAVAVALTLCCRAWNTCRPPWPRTHQVEHMRA